MKLDRISWQNRAHFFAIAARAWLNRELKGSNWGCDPFNALHFSLKDERTLRIRFDSSLFNEQWSGDIEYRLKVSQPRLFLEHLEQLG